MDGCRSSPLAARLILFFFSFSFLFFYFFFSSVRFIILGTVEYRSVSGFSFFLFLFLFLERRGTELGTGWEGRLILSPQKNVDSCAILFSMWEPCASCAVVWCGNFR